MITKTGRDLALLNDMPEEHQIPYMVAAYKDMAVGPKRGWRETLKLPVLGIGGLGALSGAVSAASKWTPQAYLRRPTHAIAGGIGGAIGGAGIGAVLGALKKIRADNKIDDAREVLKHQKDPMAMAERVAQLRSAQRALERRGDLLTESPEYIRESQAYF